MGFPLLLGDRSIDWVDPSKEKKNLPPFQNKSYRNFKIHRLLRKCAHVIIETKPVFALLFRRKDKIPLSLLGRFHNDLAIRGDDAVIEVKRSTGLDLDGST